MKPWSGATTNRHLCSSGERNQEQRRTKVSFGRTMMRVLELQRLVKRHISGQSDVESEEIEPLALLVIELRLSKGIR